MQATKSFAEVQELIENYVERLVFCSPSHVIYETSSLYKAELCKELLKNYSAYTVTKDGKWFVSVPL